MSKPIFGVHHVTAIASDAQRTFDFYTQTLGMRLVKKTINFDDPGTYHLYFGDEIGTPGTVMTFFPWAGATRGTAGSGEVVVTSYSVPVGSLTYWEQRLQSASIPAERTGRRFDEEVLRFADPDGMRLELVAHTSAVSNSARTWDASPVPIEYAIRGFFGVTLLERDLENTAHVLGLMGLQQIGSEADRFRYAAAEGGTLGNHIDIAVDVKAGYGRLGAGSVHHVAFRLADDDSQVEWMTRLAAEGLSVTPVQDRTYFHSVYFREPGGVLFELATDAPGFDLDEPVFSLGQALKLPDWLESQRERIERSLPPLTQSLAKEVRA